MKATNPNFFTLQQAADQLGRNYFTVREDALAGRLAVVRFTPRGRYYVKPADLDAFVKRSRSGAVGE
jgi:hypothetical protein